MKAKVKQTGVRSTLEIQSCPLDSRSSVMWGLQHFFSELYYKRPHFKNLKICLENDRTLRDHYSDQDLATMVVNGKDPIAEILSYTFSLSDIATDKREDVLRSWSRAETTLNARLVLSCAIGGPKFTTAIFSSMLPWNLKNDELAVSHLVGKLEGKCYDDTFGQPDLLFQAPSGLVMVEMKVRGNPGSNAKYDANQFIKYLRLAHHAAEILTIENICHFIFSPNGGSSPFYHPERWMEQTTDGDRRIIINVDGLANGTNAKAAKKWLKKERNRELISETLKNVKICQRSYEDLLNIARHYIPANEWEKAAITQLEVLVRDAEPSKIA